MEPARFAVVRQETGQPFVRHLPGGGAAALLDRETGHRRNAIARLAQRRAGSASSPAPSGLTTPAATTATRALSFLERSVGIQPLSLARGA